MTLSLHGMGHFHPENEITNQFLESLDIGKGLECVQGPHDFGLAPGTQRLPIPYRAAVRERRAGVGWTLIPRSRGARARSRGSRR